MCVRQAAANATTQVTATHRTVLQVIQGAEGLAHKIFMDNYFNLSAMFANMFQRKINACRTSRHGRRGLPQDIGLNSLKMKRWDIVICVRRNLRATHWKDRCGVFILTNMHILPVEGSFTDEPGHAIKPCPVEDYSAYMGFVDKSDRMVSSYRTAQRTWKWPKKLFFLPYRHDHSQRVSYQ